MTGGALSHPSLLFILYAVGYSSFKVSMVYVLFVPLSIFDTRMGLSLSLLDVPGVFDAAKIHTPEAREYTACTQRLFEDTLVGG